MNRRFCHRSGYDKRSDGLYHKPSAPVATPDRNGSSCAAANNDGTVLKNNLFNISRVISQKWSLDFQKKLPPLPQNHPHRPMFDEINESPRSPPLLPRRINKVIAAQNSIHGAVCRVLGPYNTACIKPKGATYPRVGKHVTVPKGNTVRTPETFVPYTEWHSSVNKDKEEHGDVLKKQSKDRVKACQQTQWTKSSIATRLGCPIEQLDLIIMAVDHQPIDTTLLALAMLPETARYPTSNTNPTMTTVPVSFAVGKKLILPPITDTPGWTARSSRKGLHPQGKRSWNVSETFTPEGLSLWNKLGSAIDRTSVALSKGNHRTVGRPRDIWISERSHMQPFVWGKDVHISEEGVCSWTEYSGAPQSKFVNAAEFNESMKKMGGKYNVHIRDDNTLACIKYGFDLVHSSMARGIFVSFPKEIIYEPNIKKSLNDAIRSSLSKKETRLITRPDSTNCRIHSCSSVTKNNTSEKRLTKNMSAPYDLTDLSSGKPIALNTVARLVRGVRDKLKFWWLMQMDFQNNAAVTVYTSACVRQHHPELALEFTPHIFATDAAAYYDIFRLLNESEDMVSSWSTLLDRLMIAKNITPGFGASDVPDICQAAANIRCSEAAIMYLIWIESIIFLAEEGEKTAQIIAPTTYIEIYRRRKMMHNDDGKQWAIALYEAYVDDTASHHLSWSMAIAMYLIGTYVDACNEVDQSWHKLVFGRMGDHLGLYHDMPKGFIKLTASSLQFLKRWYVRAMNAEWIEWVELESMLSKLQHKLALVPGSQHLMLRAYRWMSNGTAWNRDQHGRIVAPAQPFWKTDVVIGVVYALTLDPTVSLLSGIHVKDDQSATTFMDSCRHQKTNKFCGMGAVTLMRGKAIIWIKELTKIERQVLPVHVTEAWTALVNKYVLCFTLYTLFIPLLLDERIDNKAAMNVFTNMKSRDPRLTEILMLKQDIDIRIPTVSRSSYINTKLNPADLISRGLVQELIELLLRAGYHRSDIILIDLDTPEWIQRIDTRIMSQRLIDTTHDMMDPNKSKCVPTAPTSQYLIYTQCPLYNVHIVEFVDTTPNESYTSVRS